MSILVADDAYTKSYVHLSPSAPPPPLFLRPCPPDKDALHNEDGHDCADIFTVLNGKLYPLSFDLPPQPLQKQNPFMTIRGPTTQAFLPAEYLRCNTFDRFFRNLREELERVAIPYFKAHLMPHLDALDLRCQLGLFTDTTRGDQLAKEIVLDFPKSAQIFAIPRHVLPNLEREGDDKNDEADEDNEAKPVEGALAPPAPLVLRSIDTLSRELLLNLWFAPKISIRRLHRYHNYIVPEIHVLLMLGSEAQRQPGQPRPPRPPRPAKPE